MYKNPQISIPTPIYQRETPQNSILRQRQERPKAIVTKENRLYLPIKRVQPKQNYRRPRCLDHSPNLETQIAKSQKTQKQKKGGETTPLKEKEKGPSKRDLKENKHAKPARIMTKITSHSSAIKNRCEIQQR